MFFVFTADGFCFLCLPRGADATKSDFPWAYPLIGISAIPHFITGAGSRFGLPAWLAQLTPGLTWLVGACRMSDGFLGLLVPSTLPRSSFCPFWWQPLGAVQSQHLGKPRAGVAGQRGSTVVAAELEFGLWCLRLLSFQQWCFNLRNAMLGFRCAQLEFLPRHRTAEIAEFACGFQHSAQSLLSALINFPQEQGWSGTS